MDYLPQLERDLQVDPVGDELCKWSNFLSPYIACVPFAILRESLDYMLPYRDIALDWHTLFSFRIQRQVIGYSYQDSDVDFRIHNCIGTARRKPTLASSPLNLCCQKRRTSPSPILFRAPLLHEARNHSDSRMFDLASSLLFQPHQACSLRNDGNSQRWRPFLFSLKFGTGSNNPFQNLNHPSSVTAIKSSINQYWFRSSIFDSNFIWSVTCGQIEARRI